MFNQVQHCCQHFKVNIDILNKHGLTKTHWYFNKKYIVKYLLAKRSAWAFSLGNR